jgi:hypothetical protein
MTSLFPYINYGIALAWVLFFGGFFFIVIKSKNYLVNNTKLEIKNNNKVGWIFLYSGLGLFIITAILEGLRMRS